MGLRGAHARQPQRNVAPAAPAAWKRKRTRVGRVVAFLESLPITKGIYAGKKMKLLPGQRRFIEAVYGRVAVDGRRQIRIAIKSEPRGNGKTGLLAGLALCHLLGPECEVRGEVYSCAFNKLQAALIFAEMRAIIEATPEFDGRCNLQRYGKVIEVLEGDGVGSVYESLSADDRRAHGLAPSFWIFDEFAQSPNSDLLDTLRSAMGKRSESLGVIISTQAANDLHPLSQLVDDAALGEDPSVYLQLAAAPIDADIFDERTWFDCNEALGKFLDLNEFRAQAPLARQVAQQLSSWTSASFARASATVPRCTCPLLTQSGRWSRSSMAVHWRTISERAPRCRTEKSFGLLKKPKYKQSKNKMK